MNTSTNQQPLKTTGDLVLQEVWRAKDALSAAYDHDLDKFFDETSQREKLSGHPLIHLNQGDSMSLSKNDA